MNLTLKGFIKILDWFKNDRYYFFVQQHGGYDFFEYIYKCHEKISKNEITINEWKYHIRKLFKQMILFIKWLHDKNLCHLDISLENLLIDKNNTVKFCDFGLSEIFPSNDFTCRKYTGKVAYLSPEVL